MRSFCAKLTGSALKARSRSVAGAFWKRLACSAVTALSFIGCWSDTGYAGDAELTCDAPTEYDNNDPLTVSGYRVYWGCSVQGAYPNNQAFPADACHFNLGELPDVGSCYFVVTAFDAQGKESLYSNVASKVMGLDGEPPGKASLFVEFYEPPAGPPVMTAIRSSSQASNGSGTAVAITAPSGTAAGDLVLVVVHSNNVTTIADNNGGTPFTESVNDYQETDAGLTASLFVRRIQSGDPGTYNFTLGTSSRWGAIAVALSSPHASTIFDVVSSNTQQGGGVDATMTAASITTLTANAIHFAVFGADGSGNAFVTAPDGYTTHQNLTSNQTLLVTSKVIASPGATGAQSADFTTTNGAFAFSFAIIDHTAGGAATITGSGTPAAQSATTAGTGERTVEASGTPSAQSAAVAGTAERSVVGTGTPAAQSATADGTGVVGAVVTGSGTPAAQSATAAGTGERSVVGTGTPAAQSASTAGTAERSITSSGTPAAQAATVEGTGTAASGITGTGSVIAQSATVEGTAERSITALGTPSAQSASVAGVGTGPASEVVQSLGGDDAWFYQGKPPKQKDYRPELDEKRLRDQRELRDLLERAAGLIAEAGAVDEPEVQEQAAELRGELNAIEAVAKRPEPKVDLAAIQARVDSLIAESVDRLIVQTADLLTELIQEIAEDSET